MRQPCGKVAKARPGLGALCTFVSVPLTAGGEVAGRDMLYELEHADVMTLLAGRYDRTVRSLSCVPE